MNHTELFIEIGTEELPARFVRPALDGLLQGVEKLLTGVRHGAMRVWGTPRRLAIAVADVADARATVERLVTGPPAASAFRDGRPTPVGESFARARGVDARDLLIVDTPKGPVAGFMRLEGGESTVSLLAAGLEAMVLGLPFKKSMRWGNLSYRYGRPIHTVLAKYGDQVIDATVAGVMVTGRSHGHWLWSPEPFSFADSNQYIAELRRRYVIADIQDRRHEILHQLGHQARSLGCDALFDDELLDEVVNLVEWPHVIVGSFDQSLLALPPRLLVEAMKKHQRYFPLYRDGALTHQFLVVTNNPHGDDELIAAGNARVLAARFYDARFFYAEDRKLQLAEHGQKLAGTLWIRGLGTMADRQAGVARAAVALAPLLGSDPTIVARAGALCKCDLSTSMVGEFPELQGHVGRLLAELQGEPVGVPIAIEEHYLPRFAGDALPISAAGVTLALAERLTLLARCFSAGIKPSGSADPQGLRRAAQGVVQLLLDRPLSIELSTLLAAACPNEVALHADIIEFILTRLRATLSAEQLPTDVVEAVLATGIDNVALIAERVRAIGEEIQRGTFGPVRITFRRAAGLVKEHGSATYDPAHFVAPVEVRLHQAIQELPDVAASTEAVIAALAAMRPVVDAFFDGVLVMCEEEVLRNNRLGLLKAVTLRFAGFADFTRLSTEI